MKYAPLITLSVFLVGSAGSFVIGGSHAYRGQKYITGAGTVDINTGGQGVRVKVDAAGITWTGSHLNGMVLTDEALVVANAGDYKVTWHVAFDGTQGKRYLFEIITDTNADPSDGSPVDQAGCHNDLSVQANTHMSVSGCCLATITAGEYIYLAVQEPGAGAGTDFDIDHGGLVLTKQYSTRTCSTWICRVR